MSTSGKTIREILDDYNDAKFDLQQEVKTVVSKAVELGCDEKIAEDVRISLAYLHGYLRSPKRSE